MNGYWHDVAMAAAVIATIVFGGGVWLTVSGFIVEMVDGDGPPWRIVPLLALCLIGLIFVIPLVRVLR